LGEFSEYIVLDTYGVERLIEELEYAEPEEVRKALSEIEMAKNKLSQLEARLREHIGAKPWKYRPTEETEEIEEEEAEEVEMEEVYEEEIEKWKQLSAEEMFTIALSLKPMAPERIRREAEEIMAKYGLTAEDARKIYEFVMFPEGEKKRKKKSRKREGYVVE